ncbi:hypothetical protein [Streptomyces sp. NPDC087300]|uniref:hypothetical protein n=1 Tax=Streptomyces sp. NPDC087300 TaxID=3365780 RepID=UPI00381A4B2E
MEQERQDSTASSPGPEDDYLVDLDFDDGWLGLTLHLGIRAEARYIAAERVEQFAPQRLSVSRAALQQELEKRALTAYKSGPVLTAAAYTEGGVFLAELSAFAYGEDGVQRPSPEEYLPRLVRWPHAKMQGQPRVSDVQLPLGPAVRFQAVLAEKRRLGRGKKLSEALLYGVWPDGREEILVVEARWFDFERTDELADLVDGLMPTMGLLPVPAEPATDASGEH